MQNSPEKAPRISPGIALILGVLAASTSAVFVRYAQEEVPSVVISALRLGLAALLLLPVAILRRRSSRQGTGRSQFLYATLAGFFLAVHFGTWITSLEYTNVASSVVLVQTNPLFVALLSPLLLREPLPRSVLLGLGIALVGSSVVGLSDVCSFQNQPICPDLNTLLSGDAVKGDLLALAGALSGALYLIIGRRVRGSMDLIPYITLVYSVAAFVLMIGMLLLGLSPFGYTPKSYLWIVLLALFPQLLAHSTYNWALAFLPAAIVSLSLLGEPVSSALLAYILLGETPTWFRIGGAVLVLGGIAFAILPRDKSADHKRSLRDMD